MTTANEVTEPAPFSLEVEMVEGEPRVLDTDLAKQLGMARATNIRSDLIAPNREELEGFGSLQELAANPGAKGGKPSKAFYLNRQQALLICILSKTDRAKDVRAEVIHRFDAYEAPAAQPAPQPPAMDQLMGAMTMLVQTMQGFVQAVATKAPERRPPSGRRKGTVMSNQMALALNASEALTMSSLEIAELTGKEHKNVMRDSRVMFEALGVTGLSFERSYRDSTGRSLPCFHLPKRETIILVTGYSVPMRAAVVDRWQELEAAAVGETAPKVPQTLAQALRLAADQAGAGKASSCPPRS